MQIHSISFQLVNALTDAIFHHIYALLLKLFEYRIQ